MPASSATRPCQVNTSYNDRSAAPGSTNFTAVGTEDYDAESIKTPIDQSIDNMIAAGTIPETNGTLSFSKFADHGKMHPRLTADVLKTGFIQEQLLPSVIEGI